MKLAMTLAGSGAAEIVDAQIAFHLHAGVDVVVAEGRRDPDVTEVLEAYRREGHLHLLEAPADALPLPDRVTDMARLAAAKLGADWVINASDAEFWWPRGGTLAEVLAAVPRRYGIVRAMPRYFVPVAADGSSLAERSTVRRSTAALVTSRGGRASECLGVVHIGDPDVVVGSGGAPAGSSLVALRAWYPIEVLRLPCGDSGEALDSASVSRGLADGTLVVDVRLRDALRKLRLPDLQRPSSFALPSEAAAALVFPRPSVVDDAAYAEEVTLVAEVDGADMQRRLDEAERRLAALEAGFGARARWKLGRLLGAR